MYIPIIGVFNGQYDLFNQNKIIGHNSCVRFNLQTQLVLQSNIRVYKSMSTYVSGLFTRAL